MPTETMVGLLREGDVILEGWYELAGLTPATVIKTTKRGDYETTLKVVSASGKHVTVTQDNDMYCTIQER